MSEEYTPEQQADEAREAWLAERRKHITGTDVAKIMGLSPFGGPTSVWLDKKGLSAPFTETERMGWGRRLEEAILLGYAGRRGVEVSLVDPHILHISERHPLLAASLDGLVSLPGGQTMPVDSKNVGRFDPTKWGEEDTNIVPDQYALQMAVQMLVTEAPVGDLAVLFGGQKLVLYRIERNTDVERAVVETSYAWWDRYIVHDVQPPPDGSLAYSEHLQKSLKQTREALLDATPEAIEWASILRETEAKLDALEKVKEEAQQYIKEAIGAAAGITGPGFRVTWKKSKDGSAVDWEQVATFLANKMGLSADAVAELMGRYTIPKPGSRRFLPKWIDQ